MSDSNESFKDMFEREPKAAPRARTLEVGEEIEGAVSHVGRDAVFVELGGSSGGGQAYFERIDLAAHGQELSLQVGDAIRGLVVEVDDAGQVRLGRGFGRGVSAAELTAALDQSLPIEGKVVGVNKGGLEVEVAGARAFCPVSQIGDRFVEDPSTFVGQTLRFLVTEIRERGGAVLSRRKLLEREAQVKKTETLSRLEVGAVAGGRVTEVRDFGVFVDLGGLQGLVPRSELSHDRSRVEDVVAVGDVVEVRIARIEQDDKGRPRISLSLKALSQDPWDNVLVLAPVGRVVAGQVSKLAEFGAFVRLAPGVEGLVHVSETEGETPLEVGQQILCVVKSVDAARRRIALVPADAGADVGGVAQTVQTIVGAVIECEVIKIERFGVFVQLPGTRGRAGRGLVPNAELGVERGVDMRKAFPLGTRLRAKILETGEGKLRLSVRAAHDDAERAEYDGYRQAQDARGGMGTLGEILKKKLT